jgi:hypothetical protein
MSKREKAKNMMRYIRCPDTGAAIPIDDEDENEQDS